MSHRYFLLIDDDADDGEIFVSALSEASASAQCTVINSAAEALVKLSAGEQSPDIIFLDLNMPGMNGQQFLVAAKKDPVVQEIPIIIFSTSSHPQTIELTRELGAKGYHTKPSDFDALVLLLKKFVH